MVNCPSIYNDRLGFGLPIGSGVSLVAGWTISASIGWPGDPDFVGSYNGYAGVVQMSQELRSRWSESIWAVTSGPLWFPVKKKDEQLSSYIGIHINDYQDPGSLLTNQYTGK